MQCRSCGTDIADKAIVCYRCGTATTDPVRRPVVIKDRRSPVAPLTVVGVLIVAALSLGYMSRTAAEPEQWQLLAGLCAGGAAAVLLLTVLRRR
jgi:RsiW-degrading membrane proteinase PrsW (M82 family)